MMRKRGERSMSQNSEIPISIILFCIRSQPVIETEVLSTTGIPQINESLFGSSYTYGSIFGYA